MLGKEIGGKDIKEGQKGHLFLYDKVSGIYNIYGVIKYMETGREKREKEEVFGGSDSSGKRGGLLGFPL